MFRFRKTVAAAIFSVSLLPFGPAFADTMTSYRAFQGGEITVAYTPEGTQCQDSTKGTVKIGDIQVPESSIVKWDSCAGQIEMKVPDAATFGWIMIAMADGKTYKVGDFLMFSNPTITSVKRDVLAGGTEPSTRFTITGMGFGSPDSFTANGSSNDAGSSGGYGMHTAIRPYGQSLYVGDKEVTEISEWKQYSIVFILPGTYDGKLVSLRAGTKDGGRSPYVFEQGGAATPPTPVAVTPKPAPGAPFDRDAERNAAVSINDDKTLPPASGQVPCASGTLIKGKSSAAVYYCGANGKRFVFPDFHTYSTWYSNFDGVVTLTDEQLAAIPIGGVVTYRPGTRMIKITSDPTVYAVGANGELRPISSEAIARRLYGADWNKQIDDISDAFFTNYKVGAPISE